MRSHALAIAWELRQRHRWGFAAAALVLAELGIVKWLDSTSSIEVDDAETFAFLILVPLTSVAFYFLAVFSFGLSGDLGARQSMYPARMFTLPVTTAALVGWPMLFGCTAMAALWIAARCLAVWPRGSAVPVIWPALLGAAVLAWTQALTWMPYPLPGMRVVIAVFCLVTIDTIVLIALELKAGEGVMIAILAPQIPIAYVAARWALARARRGEVPDWGGRAATTSSGESASFSSAGRAQAWFEWRHYGRSLPALVAMVVPFELALLVFFARTPELVLEVVAAALLTPAFLAAFVAATVRDARLTSFLATRPLTGSSMVAAKIAAAFRSTLLAWLIVLVAIPAALSLTGTTSIVLDVWRNVVAVVGPPRAFALVLFILAMLVSSTWKQLVQSLYLGLSGNPWLIRASVIVPLCLLTAGVPLLHWILDSHARVAILWAALPWILAGLAVVKVVAGARMFVLLQARCALSDRAIVLTAAWWSAVVFAMFALLAWITPALIMRRYVLVLLAILLTPLVRLAAAPLALERNRHR